MYWTFDERLRHSSAWIDDITPSNPVELWAYDTETYNNGIISGERIISDTPMLKHTIKHGVALKSYSSIVAFYDSDNSNIYLMPRWDYSVTTMQHVRKFIEDYTYIPRNYSVKDVRRGKYDYMIEWQACTDSGFKRIGYDSYIKQY